MFKKMPHLLALLVLAAGSGSAYASCDGTGGYSQLTGAQITSLIAGTIACYPSGPPYENQEILAGGIITDYKQGPGDPVDPSKAIGTYVVSIGLGKTITYTYTGGPSFLYTVWGTTTSGPGNYDFCGGATSPITIRVASGSGPC